MSYEKAFKSCLDFAVGTQSINRVLDNNRALFEQYDLRHSMGVGGLAYGDPFLGSGRHDDPKIARTAADFYVDTSSTTPTLGTWLSGPMLSVPPVRISTGKWRIYVSTPKLFSAVATCRATAAGARYATCVVTIAPSGPYVLVTTWNVESAAPADYDFSVVFWADEIA